MRKLILFILVFYCQTAIGQMPQTKFEKSGGAESPTYFDIIDWWKKMDAFSPNVKMMEMGPTDAGYPLHLVMISSDKTFDIKSIRTSNKTIILVNNGIHPGEPDGIDASMMLVKEITENKFKLPSNVVLAIIPVYNIGGCLNRSPNNRIDQNGPVEKGSRGNSENLDLNRDFIKCDSKEALSFAKIFSMLDPDVFVDNHVSNGADYQHVMTLLTTQHNKLGGAPGDFIHVTFEPALYSSMKKLGWDLVPYVNHFGSTLDKGWPEFWDSPRYGSGYGALWNTFSFVPETHMLKPYKQRVEATRDLMKCFIDFTSSQSNEILKLRKEAKEKQLMQTSFPIAWKWDKTQSRQITFKGFESGYKPSEVSGLPRLYYDRNKPYELKLPFYDQYIDTLTVQKPLAYIIPQGWWKVIERLQANNIQMRRLTKDSTVEVECYHIENYQTSPRPYEGHHLNSGVKISSTNKKINFRKGDWFISLNQPANRFLIETLEPQAEDSYFTWNFFDPILGQKEGYSDYAFEETANAYLKSNPELRSKLEQRKLNDTAFAKNGRMQLDFVYQNSPFFEPGYLQYPVYRVTKKQ